MGGKVPNFLGISGGDCTVIQVTLSGMEPDQILDCDFNQLIQEQHFQKDGPFGHKEDGLVARSLIFPCKSKIYL